MPPCQCLVSEAVWCYILLLMVPGVLTNMGVSETSGFFPPNHPLNNRVFHEINHPFWCFPPIFWKHPIWWWPSLIHWVTFVLMSMHLVGLIIACSMWDFPKKKCHQDSLRVKSPKIWVGQSQFTKNNYSPLIPRVNMNVINILHQPISVSRMIICDLHHNG